MIIQPPHNQSVCEGGTVNFTCVVMFTSISPNFATWLTDGGYTSVIALSDHSQTDDIYNRSAPANVTNVLTVTNVSISDNGRDYYCQQGERSDPAILTVFGELMKCYVCTYINNQPANFLSYKPSSTFKNINCTFRKLGTA